MLYGVEIWPLPPHLSLEERKILAKPLAAKIPVREIAEYPGRDRSIIIREIRRNAHVGDELPELNGYHTLAAQDSYEHHREVHRKLVYSPQLEAAFERGLIRLGAESYHKLVWS